MSPWSQVTWDVARAGGFVAYGLLTLSVALGLALSLRWQARMWPRLLNSELHNFVTLLAMAFTIIHVLAVWLDPFTAFGWSEVFIPFVSHYRPLWMAFGIVGLYLGLALAASIWLRPRFGYEWWRRLHVLTLLIYALVTVHGVTTGSDTQTPWAVLVYVASALVVAALLWMRLLTPASPQQRRHPIWAALTGLALFAGATLMVVGPLRPGWNDFANGGNGSGGRGGVSVPRAGVPTPTPIEAPPAASALTPPFTARAAGTLRMQGPDARGHVTVIVTATLSDGARGVLEVQLTGAREPDGALLVSSAQALVGSDWSAPSYRGSLTDLHSSGDDWRLVGALRPVSRAGPAMDLQIALSIHDDNSVSGSVQGAMASATNGGDGDS